jgi:hypothetical protein
MLNPCSQSVEFIPDGRGPALRTSCKQYRPSLYMDLLGFVLRPSSRRQKHRVTIWDASRFQNHRGLHQQCAEYHWPRVRRMNEIQTVRARKFTKERQFERKNEGSSLLLNDSFCIYCLLCAYTTYLNALSFMYNK